MAEPITDRIVAQAVTQMLVINGTGGYTTTLGTTIDENGDAAPSVEDSRTDWDEEELPAISVFEGDATVPNPEAFDKSTIVMQTMRLLFRGSVKQGTTARAARRLNADILKAIRANERFTVSGTDLVGLTRQVRHGIIRNEGSYEVEGCEVEIEVLFATQKFNAEA
jgi:hypothetical protein